MQTKSIAALLFSVSACLVGCSAPPASAGAASAGAASATSSGGEDSTPMGCTPGSDLSYVDHAFPTLDRYCLLTIDDGDIHYSPAVLPYDLTTPLFSDYAEKRRAVWLPPGAQATYDSQSTFAFPEGSVLIKSFGFPEDARKPSPTLRWIETRLLVRTGTGWAAYAYRWDDAQKVATYNPAGGSLRVSWIDAEGTKHDNPYLQPTKVQCRQCHEANAIITPIGPKARYLNRDFLYPDGTSENQLTRWTKAGMLAGAPADPSAAPRLPSWDDAAHITVEKRARAYLEVNCAHCHDKGGTGSNSGLFLWADETDPLRLGICKEPLSAGAGVGMRNWDIVPGHPEQSVLWYRMASAEPGIAMPQIGRDVPHAEAADLIKEWITALPPGPCNQ
jgi:uncharacterized repeat protein (TIGR03806 family)